MKCMLALFLLGLVAGTLATTCYTCSNSECNDGSSGYTGSSSHETDCETTVGETEDGGCSKEKSRVKILGTWIESVTRECGKGSNEYCTKPLKINVFGIKSHTWTCACDGDKCNGGSQATFSAGLLAAVVAKMFL